ncbi:MAG: hypothetical protein R2867_42510 [Caldilineaceae bacterium]
MPRPVAAIAQLVQSLPALPTATENHAAIPFEIRQKRFGSAPMPSAMALNSLRDITAVAYVLAVNGGSMNYGYHTAIFLPR